MSEHPLAERPLKIACIGECMGELTASGSGYQLSFAGDTFNTAAHLSRIFENTAHSVSYVTVIGEDDISRQMEDRFVEECLDTELVFRAADRTIGLYLINNDDHGERFFTYWRDNSAARTLMTPERDAILREKLATFDLLYLSGITFAILPAEGRRQLLNLINDLQVPVAFDPNYRSNLWETKKDCLQICDKIAGHVRYLLSSFDDETALREIRAPTEAAQAWRSKGVPEIIIKNGGAATHILTDQAEQFSPEEVIAKPIDTSGAGDAFNAAYLAKRLCGHPVGAACAAGQALSAQVIMHSGAVAPKK